MKRNARNAQTVGWFEIVGWLLLTTVIVAILKD